MKKGLNKLNRLELALYRTLGILKFRKCILWVEKIKHRKDGLRNKNYHLKYVTADSMETHTGYLLYNSLIHIFSLLFVGIYFVIALIVDKKSIWLDSFMIIIALLDIYCLLLQRLVYLKLKDLRYRYERKNVQYIEKKRGIVLEKLEELRIHWDEETIRCDRTLLFEIKECRETGRDCFLTASDLPVLKRWAELLEGVCISYCRLEKPSEKEKKQSFVAELASVCAEQAKPYAVIEKYAASLYRIFCRRRNGDFALVTADGEVENLYKKIFPVDSADQAVRVIGILDAVYEQMLETGG